MIKGIDCSYNKGLESLYDLSSLCDSELSPLISNIHYHFSQIRREAHLDLLDNDTFGEIRNFLDRQCVAAINQCFLEKLSCSQMVLQKRSSAIGLDKWNKLLGVIPLLLKMLPAVPYVGTVVFQIDENGVRVSGKISDAEEIITARTKIYEISRKLFALKSMLTFKVDEENIDVPKLELFVDITHNDDEYYYLQCKEHKIAFSNILQRYEVTPQASIQLQKHLCIEITDTLSLIRHEQIPDKFNTHKTEFGFIHFPFLFRPVSIIIPKRGRLILNEDLDQVDSSKCHGSNGIGLGIAKRGQDEIKYIDLFSLLSN